MKYIPQVFIIIIFTICICQTIQKNNPDHTLNHAINVTGGNFSNSDGSLFYSIGQVFHFYNGEENGVQEGVQHPPAHHLLVEKLEQIFNIAAFPQPTVNYITIQASSYLYRSLIKTDNYITSNVSNTLACTSSATLTFTPGFSEMKFVENINIEDPNTTLIFRGGTGVIINGQSGGNKNPGNDEVYTGGLVKKPGDNSYIVLS